MPIDIVDPYHNDNSQEPVVILTEAASLCYGLAVKNTSGYWHFLLSFFIMTNTLKTNMDVLIDKRSLIIMI